MPAIWDPRAALDVYPDRYSFTCVGKTLKGLRCRNSFISREDIIEATLILDRIATTHPSTVSYEDLRELATLVLCPRWHRKPSHSQIGAVSRGWMRSLQTIVVVSEPLASREAREVSVNSERQGRTQLSSAGDSASSQMRSGPSNPRPRPVRRVERSGLTTPPRSPSPLRSSPVEPSRSSSPRPSSPSRPLPSSRSPPLSSSRSPPPSSSRSSPLSPALSISSLATEAPRPLQSRTPSETHDRHHSPSSSPAPSLPRQTCPSHPIRKPITDPCPVCMEAFCCPDDAVWCRAECGQNIHRSCFGEWYRQTQLTGAIVTCVYCRTPWKPEWEV